ncbi:V-type proton ATPase 16 kDa proteolipid subunit [Frankliniella fusca]|uniref:V-type proton ATPase proteolipid subunit n=1 Tax=Frankliniella fusca TaxID=407009 RepID=A0AAE1HPJ5_9NEOP|nr:V-type proton ATPase 16 kDa proteolipid subunit [Frankliniella fusca]
MASDGSTWPYIDGVPVYTPFIGVMGAAASITLSSWGACYGTAKSGAAISAVGVHKPELVMKSIIPVVMAGIVAIYGLVVSILIITNLKAPPEYTLFVSLLHLGAGVTVGGAGAAAGYAIGIVGDHGVRYNSREGKLFITMILILIFAEVLGLYGLILAVFMYANSTTS